jgi:hypothetical protein
VLRSSSIINDPQNLLVKKQGSGSNRGIHTFPLARIMRPLPRPLRPPLDNYAAQVERCGKSVKENDSPPMRAEKGGPHASRAALPAFENAPPLTPRNDRQIEAGDQQVEVR